MRQEEALNGSIEIWIRWTKYYKNLGIDPVGICKDGIVDQDKFENTYPRVLFVLQEVTKFPGGDLRILFKETLAGLGKNIARCSAGIYNNFPEYKEIEKMDDALLRQYTAKIAVICLKKVSDRSASPASLINAYVKQDKNLLLEQIGLMKPVLIVACNTFDFLIKLLNLRAKANLSEPIVDTRRKAWIIPLRYPANADQFPINANGRQMYNNLKDQIWRKIDY